MEEKKIQYVSISEIIPYENNPRKNDEAVDKVALSISAFGFNSPIAVDKNMVVINGHTRLKAAKKLGLEKVPIIICSELTDEQVKAYRLADNKVGEIAEWDEEKLLQEIAEIENIDMELYGFDIPDVDEDEPDETYTDKTNIPQYDVQGEQPSLAELVDKSKTDELIEQIENSELPYEEKQFLKDAATRHMAFNYRKIAEYYAGASPEMQELMEKSALVIIDYGDAIANGYTKLSKRIESIMEAQNA